MKTKIPGISHEELLRILKYDPDTGDFHWAVRIGRKTRAGAKAGTPQGKDRYLAVTYQGEHYLAHRLAWYYVHGVWPDGPIDHINADKVDNRIANLRVVTSSINAQNIGHRPRKSKTTLIGAVPEDNRFRAAIWSPADKRLIRLGRFDTPEEAHAAYVEAKRKLHPGCTI